MHRIRAARPAPSTLREAPILAEAPIVGLSLPRWWTWRRSAKWRRAWLAFAWVLVLCRGAFGPAALPLAAVRTTGSLVQFGWNLRLGRKQPLPPPGFRDWLLVALTLAGAAGYSVVSQAQPAGWSWLGFAAGLALLIPYSLVQLRMAERSLRAEIVAGMEGLLAGRPVLAPVALRRSRRAPSVPAVRRAA